MKIDVLIIFACSFFAIRPIFPQDKPNIQSSALSKYQIGAQGLGPGFGNNPAHENFYNDMRVKAAIMGKGGSNISLDDIEGSVYVNEDFVFGSVYYENTVFKRLFMRYNAYGDEVEFKESPSLDGRIKALIKNEKISCSIGEDDFVYTSCTGEDKVQTKAYLKVLLVRSNYGLYERIYKIFKEGKPAKTSLDSTFPHRFLEEREYYISKNGNMPEFVKRNQKGIIAFFGEENEKAIKTFIKQNNINVNDRQGLINLIAFVNEL